MMSELIDGFFMPLPDINFRNIRLQGNQANAFEELCCQLAFEEAAPTRTGFDRKGGGGDGGIECYETLADGSEIGWQVKYYFEIGSMLRSLRKSLDTALVKHPAMTKFIACFPMDLADARKINTKSALEKWNTWRTERIAAAAMVGRTIDIERWDEHAIKLRLTSGNPHAAGRIAYWFDQQLFTAEWLATKFERAKASLGDRYDPEAHIDIPISRAIRAVTGDPALFDELAVLGDAIGSKASATMAIAGTPASIACQGAARMIKAAGQSRVVSLASLRDATGIAADATLERYGALEQANGTGDPTDEMRAISALAGRIREVAVILQQPHWALLSSQSLLVYGEAGTGKSHLLADACAHQLSLNRMAILVIGGALGDAEPWGQILRSLDLPTHLEVKQFLGALNAAGEAAGARALIAIDALNEKAGQLIWPKWLPGFLHDISQFPWIAVVLSCRTTYLDAVIPDTLKETALPRIEHRGFSMAEVRAYLKQRGMTLPETPLQAIEFQNPLFLRLYCDAIEFEGEALLALGLGGVTDIFQAYTAAVARRVHTQLAIPPNRKPAEKALDALAREMADTGRGEIGLERADEIVSALHAGQEMSDNLLFQLENEGMLATEPIYGRAGELVQIVRFTFERMGDHRVAADLIARSSGSAAAGLCAPGTPLLAALEDNESRIQRGLLDALAIQLPERFDIELPDLTGLPASHRPENAFVKSLQARRLDAITTRSWELIDDIGGADLRYSTLIALATEPGHPYNARFLDAELRTMPMAERDACWSVFLAQNPEAAFHLIDWVRSSDAKSISDDRAELTAIQLCWFLTTTNRALRDKGTKALVVLLADRAKLAGSIWQKFAGLDDGYVTERIAAALYGAALQGRWSLHELGDVAVLLHADLFARNDVPPNILLRDHASGLIGYAAYRKALTPDFDLASIKPPFASTWPIRHVPDDVIAGFTCAYGTDGERFTDHIVSSALEDGDFARYILDPVVGRFSPALRGNIPLPTPQDLRNDWLADFRAKASVEDIAAYEKLIKAMAKIKGDGPVFAVDRAALREVKLAFREAIGAQRFEDWRARAENWRDEGMYQSMTTRGSAEFNLAWARRWLVWRAHDLGWSESLHHAFDRTISAERNAHEVERIGKKYQWLAIYELAARMEDHLAIRSAEEFAGPSRLRNIDPSMLRDRTEDDGWREFAGPSFWAAHVPTVEASTPSAALVWLHGDDAILDGAENIEVTSPDGRQWLVLTGFEIWESKSETLRSDTWRRIGCTIVRRADKNKLLKRLAGIHMTSHHDFPIAQGDAYKMHLGEHPWAWGESEAEDGWVTDWRPNGGDWKAPGLAVRPPTAENSAESSGYDYSISQNITLNLPAGWLMDALGLHLSDGKSIEYRNEADEIIFMDPSVALTGRNAALIERTAFLAFLKREDLVAIWAVAGEKSVFGHPHGEGFGGRRTFTRLFHSDGGGLNAQKRFETTERPSPLQRAILFGEVQEGLEEHLDGPTDEAE